MRFVIALVAALGAAPAPVAAETAQVLRCELEDTALSSDAVARIFKFEDFIHSATLELSTDYGDRLPYLFSCGANCVMRMEGEELTYRLVARPGFDAPKEVILVSEGEDGTRNDETFVVRSCEAEHFGGANQ